ncbi:unnamed protein product [Heterobilharzia americana]|nr:unnamed protein product [Heterobilharzia americana]
MLAGADRTDCGGGGGGGDTSDYDIWQTNINLSGELETIRKFSSSFINNNNNNSRNELGSIPSSNSASLIVPTSSYKSY